MKHNQHIQKDIKDTKKYKTKQQDKNFEKRSDKKLANLVDAIAICETWKYYVIKLNLIKSVISDPLTHSLTDRFNW